MPGGRGGWLRAAPRGKSFRRNGEHVGAGSIQPTAAVLVTFLPVQCENDVRQLLPRWLLVQSKTNVSCPRWVSLSREKVTPALLSFVGVTNRRAQPGCSVGRLDCRRHHPRGQCGPCRRRELPGEPVGSAAPSQPGHGARPVPICKGS